MRRKHIIKYYSRLATSKLRRHAFDIIEAAYRAIDTSEAIRRNVGLDGSILKIQNCRYDLNKFDHVYLVGVGKAAFDAAKELETILGKRITSGIVLDVKGGELECVESVIGSHPFPSIKNVCTTDRIIDLLKGLASKDLLISIVSGGGSALLCQPYKLRCGELIRVTKALMKAGATIGELNTVRKHLSEIQGGQFARFAYPATIASLIFSDVPGNDIDTVASGPTVFDTTTVSDAKGVLKKYDVLKVCRLPNCDLIETPKDKIFFKKVRNFLVVDNSMAVKAMRQQAKEFGYKTRIFSTELQGEARDVGAKLAKMARPGEALIAAGETTVTVRGTGKGGRNQEVVLGAILKMPEDAFVASFASDGEDNTDAAGAFADKKVLDTIKKKNLDPGLALKNNNAYPFFKKTGSHIITGITGANVSDLILVLQEPSGQKISC